MRYLSPRNQVSNSQRRSSNTQNKLKKINREIMVGQQTFSILLAVLALLVLTGVGGANYASSGDAVCRTNDCHEPQRKSHKPHKRILKHGSRGEDVRKLQKLLNARGLCPQPIVADGIFGPTTLTAVKKFQRQANLPVDGIVGGETWDRLFASL
ncbi:MULTISPECIES: peptidoglycan-binding domain-containing protein [unclassified Microcoleus]|uniref:peptidoglycan-binding domain-containing protein n=1 Tax=unclassified Microcoleus TaxID=2642155 RepID=UPI00312B8CED